MLGQEIGEFLIRSQAFGSLELVNLGHPGSPRCHHLLHREALTLADRVHQRVGLVLVHLRIVPLAGILSNLLQGGVEILVLLQIKLAVTIDVGIAPCCSHLLHLLRLEVLVRAELLHLCEASVFLLLRGRGLPASELGRGQRVDLGNCGLGKGCCSFCHMLKSFSLNLQMIIDFAKNSLERLTQIY